MSFTKKQKGKKISRTQTAFEEAQVLDSVEKDFKTTIINMFK